MWPSASPSGQGRLADGPYIRLRPDRQSYIWSCDFVADITHDGGKLRMLTVTDEYTRECLTLTVAPPLKSDEVLAALANLFAKRGPPDQIR